jgi:hypothetical protein
MVNGGMRTLIRHARQRSGWRVVCVPAVGEYLRLVRANSARFNESKTLLKAMFWNPGPEAPHFRIRRNALSRSNATPTAKRHK